MSARKYIHEKLTALADWIYPPAVTLRHAQWQLITAARNAASKLHIEMHPKRNSVEPKAEYNILIAESVNYAEAAKKFYRFTP